MKWSATVGTHNVQAYGRQLDLLRIAPARRHHRRPYLPARRHLSLLLHDPRLRRGRCVLRDVRQDRRALSPPGAFRHRPMPIPESAERPAAVPAASAAVVGRRRRAPSCARSTARWSSSTSPGSRRCPSGSRARARSAPRRSPTCSARSSRGCWRWPTTTAAASLKFGGDALLLLFTGDDHAERRARGRPSACARTLREIGADRDARPARHAAHVRGRAQRDASSSSWWAPRTAS